MKIRNGIIPNCPTFSFKKMREFLALFVLLTVFINCSKSIEKDEQDLSNFNINKSKFNDTSSSSIYVIKNGLGDISKKVGDNNLVESQESIDTAVARFKRIALNKYSIDIGKEFDGNKSEILIFGLLDAISEKNKINTTDSNMLRMMNSEEPIPHIYMPGFDCFLTALSGLIGIGDAYKIWRALTTGAISSGTVIATVKLIASKVGTVINVAILVYSVGECMDLWGLT